MTGNVDLPCDGMRLASEIFLVLNWFRILMRIYNLFGIDLRQSKIDKRAMQISVGENLNLKWVIRFSYGYLIAKWYFD